MKHQRLFDALECLWAFVERNAEGWTKQEQDAAYVVREETRGFPDASSESIWSVEATIDGDSVTGHTREAGEVTIKGPDKVWKKRSHGLPKGSEYEAVGHWRVSRQGPSAVTATYFWDSVSSRGLFVPMAMTLEFSPDPNGQIMEIWKQVAAQFQLFGSVFVFESNIPVWSTGVLSWRARLYKKCWDFFLRHLS